MEDNEEKQMGGEKWTVCHILRGLVPKALITEWAKVFKEMPKSFVEHVSRLFCRTRDERRYGNSDSREQSNERNSKVSLRNGNTSPQKEDRCPDGNKYMDRNPERTNVCVDNF
jgi:hypothetical protein